MSRPVVRAAAVMLLAGVMAGCSLAVPVAGFKVDDTPTGSVDRTAAFLSPKLDREDLRRARAALAVALDPQGEGTRVSWQNPQTGAKGSFAASAAPFADSDRVCRAFAGEIAVEAGAGRHLQGSACREGDGTWRVRDGVDDGKARA